MKIVFSLVFTLLICGCTDNETKDFPFNWGYLPKLTPNYSNQKKKCSGFIYSNIPLSGDNVVDRLYEVDENPSRASQEMYLGNSCIIAEISTIVYGKEENRKFNHYKISIRIPEQDSRCINDTEQIYCKTIPSSFRVWFSRYIPQENVGDTFKDKQMDQIVINEKNSRRVVFIIGTTKYETLLPDL